MKQLKAKITLLSFLSFGLLSTSLLAQYKDTHADYKKFYADSIETGSKLDRAWYHYTVEKMPDRNFILKIYNPELGQRTHFITYTDKSLTAKEGMAREWFDNGSRIYEGQYQDDSRAGRWQFFDYYTNKNTWSGSYENGWEVGDWVELDSTGRKKSLIHFTNDLTTANILFFDSSGIAIDSGDLKRKKPSEDALFAPDFDFVKTANKKGFVEAVRPGCEALTGDERRKCSDNKFLASVYGQISYPAKAIELGLEGTAFFDFVVNEKGNLTKIVVLRGVSKDITEECLKVIQALGPWVPGTKNDVPVKVSFKLPVKFKFE
ncbi:MAG: TonB family protein [Saprospiraceae bacterium]|nr:TonB family protein [Saprospiraceae bacterium]